MHVCVAQAPADKIDWSNPMRKSVSKQTGPNGAIWADVIHAQANRVLFRATAYQHFTVQSTPSQFLAVASKQFIGQQVIGGGGLPRDHLRHPGISFGITDIQRAGNDRHINPVVQNAQPIALKGSFNV